MAIMVEMSMIRENHVIKEIVAFGFLDFLERVLGNYESSEEDLLTALICLKKSLNSIGRIQEITWVPPEH